MKGLSPSQIGRWTGGRWFRDLEPSAIGDFRMDAREVRSGDVFVALNTGRRDGHEFLPQAAANGAGFALVTHPAPDIGIPQLEVGDTLRALQSIAASIRGEYRHPLVAITGSCGKTSTKDLLARLLGPGTLSTSGNLNNFIGMPLTLTRLDNNLHPHAVVEVGISLKGEMPPLAAIAAPDYAIVTCVAPAHLEGLGSIEGVAAEKAGLPAALKSGGTAFFPAYCLQWKPFAELPSKCFVTASTAEKTREMTAPNQVLVSYHATPAKGGRTELSLSLPNREAPLCFNLPHLSDGMQSNAALALTAAIEMGVAEAVLRERLTLWQPAKMRGEVRIVGETSYYVDCYNANPASMLDAVRNFRDRFPESRRFFLMGCMNELGVDTEGWHRRLGEAIGTLGEETFCIFGTQNESVRAGLLKNGVPAARVVAAATREEAAALLKDFQSKAGAVFVKGSRSYKMEEFLPEQADVRKDAH